MGEVSTAYVELSKRLAAYYTPAEITNWWNLPHPQLDNVPALTVLMDDNGPARVAKVLDRLDADAYL